MQKISKIMSLLLVLFTASCNEKHDICVDRLRDTRAAFPGGVIYQIHNDCDEFIVVDGEHVTRAKFGEQGDKFEVMIPADAPVAPPQQPPVQTTQTTAPDTTHPNQASTPTGARKDSM
jgi:hypothetical protein